MMGKTSFKDAMADLTQGLKKRFTSAAGKKKESSATDALGQVCQQGLRRHQQQEQQPDQQQDDADDQQHGQQQRVAGASNRKKPRVFMHEPTSPVPPFSGVVYNDNTPGHGNYIFYNYLLRNSSSGDTNTPAQQQQQQKQGGGGKGNKKKNNNNQNAQQQQQKEQQDQQQQQPPIVCGQWMVPGGSDGCAAAAKDPTSYVTSGIENVKQLPDGMSPLRTTNAGRFSSAPPAPAPTPVATP